MPPIRRYQTKYRNDSTAAPQHGASTATQRRCRTQHRHRTHLPLPQQRQPAPQHKRRCRTQHRHRTHLPLPHTQLPAPQYASHTTTQAPLPHTTPAPYTSAAATHSPGTAIRQPHRNTVPEARHSCLTATTHICHCHNNASRYHIHSCRHRNTAPLPHTTPAPYTFAATATTPAAATYNTGTVHICRYRNNASHCRNTAPSPHTTAANATRQPLPQHSTVTTHNTAPQHSTGTAHIYRRHHRQHRTATQYRYCTHLPPAPQHKRRCRNTAVSPQPQHQLGRFLLHFRRIHKTARIAVSPEIQYIQYRQKHSADGSKRGCYL